MTQDELKQFEIEIKKGLDAIPKLIDVLKQNFPDESESIVALVNGYGKLFQDVNDVFSHITAQATKIAELEEENKRVVKINHSVSVCADHTDDITTFDGCLICENARLRDALGKIANFKIGDAIVTFPRTYAHILMDIAQSAIKGETE